MGGTRVTGCTPGGGVTFGPGVGSLTVVPHPVATRRRNERRNSARNMKRAHGIRTACPLHRARRASGGGLVLGGSRLGGRLLRGRRRFGLRVVLGLGGR